MAIVNKITETVETPVAAAEWKFSDILADPLIRERWQKVRKFFFLRESTYDMTNRCNIRCDGCYYYEGDKQFAPENRDADAWRRLMQEKSTRNHVRCPRRRGTVPRSGIVRSAFRKYRSAVSPQTVEADPILGWI